MGGTRLVELDGHLLDGPSTGDLIDADGVADVDGDDAVPPPSTPAARTLGCRDATEVRRPLTLLGTEATAAEAAEVA